MRQLRGSVKFNAPSWKPYNRANPAFTFAAPVNFSLLIRWQTAKWKKSSTGECQQKRFSKYLETALVMMVPAAGRQPTGTMPSICDSSVTSCSQVLSLWAFGISQVIRMVGVEYRSLNLMVFSAIIKAEAAAAKGTFLAVMIDVLVLTAFPRPSQLAPPGPPLPSLSL